MEDSDGASTAIEKTPTKQNELLINTVVGIDNNDGINASKMEEDD